MGAQPIGEPQKDRSTVNGNGEQGPIARVPVWAIATIVTVAIATVAVSASHGARIAVVESSVATERELRQGQSALLEKMADRIDQILRMVYELRAREVAP